MNVSLEASMAVLARTPATLDSLLRGLPAEWTHRNEGNDTWSPFDVVGHLIHGEETDWIPRARLILTRGASVPFEPFDRFAQLERFRGYSLDELLDRFASARAESLSALRTLGLEPADLARPGRHPELGAVTLGQLVATWTVHDLGHIRQIVRAMSRQYAGEVGPWRAYLTILG